MKVLMLAPGISPHSQRPLSWLLNNGCEVTFVDTKNPQPKPSKSYKYINIPVLQGTKYFNRLFGERLGNLVQTKISTIWLRRLINQIQPDIVHIHWMDFRAHACMKTGVKPIVLTVWGSDINICFSPNESQNYTKASQNYIKMISDVLASADAIFVDSLDMVEKCEQLAECKLPIELLPIGIDTDLFKPGYSKEAKEWRDKLSIEKNTLILSSVRSLQSLYSHHTILEAFYQARSRFSAKVVLLFKTFEYGYSNVREEYKLQLINRAKELGICDSIRWISGIEDNQLPAIYALSDAIVNYPSMDAFPVTFLEAAACQCPVISCRLPSYEGTFAEKYFQLLKPNDVNSLANAMVEFVNRTRHNNMELLRDARTTVVNEFSEVITQNKLMDSYRRLQK
jgi:L-malate glycosyltransferase